MSDGEPTGSPTDPADGEPAGSPTDPADGEPPGSPRNPKDEFTLDDLIDHEKKNSRFVLVIFVIAVIFVSGKSCFPDLSRSSAPPASAAPVTSDR